MKKLMPIVPIALVVIAAAVPGLAAEGARIFPEQVAGIAGPEERSQSVRDPMLSPHAGSAAAANGAYSIALSSIGQPPSARQPAVVRPPNLARKDVIRELNDIRFRAD